MKAPSMREPALFFMVLHRVPWTASNWKRAMDRFGRLVEVLRTKTGRAELRTSMTQRTSATTRRAKAGQAAVWQARLIMLVMINIAQLWILAATVDAALARHYVVLLPLVVASGVCFLITLSIIKWWRPTSRRKTSTGYVRETDR
jgi:hypothetical protein